MNLVAALLRHWNTDWQIVKVDRPVRVADGELQTGNLFKRRVGGKIEYRVPTAEELQNELYWQAVR